MKKLPREVIEKISDFEAESELSLPAYALEKDHFVFDAIALIQSLPKGPDFQFVFCGGTCLAKAYGILERMSEDIDFKLVPSQNIENLSKSALRTKLSSFIKKLIDSLEEGGFGKGTITRRSLDSNTYTGLDIEYESAFSKPSSLRNHLLIEINYAVVSASTNKLKVGLLIDKLITGDYQSPIEIECISILEAMAEKLVSFPRRLALQLAHNKMNPLEANSGWDKALVRHLYDLHRISQTQKIDKDTIEGLVGIVSKVIVKDALEYSNQHPEFCLTPLDTLEDAMKWAGSSVELKNQYEAFIADMVYAPAKTIPSFKDAHMVFSDLLKRTLERLNQGELSEQIAEKSLKQN